MGLSSANLFLYAPASIASVCGATDYLADTVLMAGRTLGYEPVGTLPEADHYFAAMISGAWSCLWDRNSPPIVTSHLVSFAKQLSRSAEAPVLLTSVVDSDDFAFLVFDAGRQVDGFASHRGLLPVRFSKLSHEPRVALWSRVFGRSLSSERIREITEPGAVFAESSIVRLCELLGAPSRFVTQDSERSVAGIIQHFYFQTAQAPSGNLGIEQVGGFHFGKGKPASKSISLAQGEELALGHEFSLRSASVCNPALEIFGSAIESSLLSCVDAGALWTCATPELRRHSTNGNITTVERNGTRTLRISFQDVSAGSCGFPPGRLSILFIGYRLSANVAGSGEFKSRFIPSSESTEAADGVPGYLITIGPEHIGRLSNDGSGQKTTD